jgi:hypothetical protein
LIVCELAGEGDLIVCHLRLWRTSNQQIKTQTKKSVQMSKAGAATNKSE